MLARWNFEPSLSQRAQHASQNSPVFRFLRYFLCYFWREFLASGKFFCHSIYLPSSFGTSVVSSLVPANLTRTSSFCRFIVGEILWFKPLSSPRFFLGVFQILPVFVQLPPRSDHVSDQGFSRSVKVKKCTVRIWSRSGQIGRKTAPDLLRIKVPTRVCWWWWWQNALINTELITQFVHR